MSLPRQIIPGATHFVTRTTTQREFLLKPSEFVNQVFLYCLAVAAERTGVIVHAVCVMSNHYHAVLTDPLGKLPEFYGWLHEFVGKCLNIHYDREGNFWSTDETSVVRLVDHDAVLRKLAYTITNPVTAGLVSHHTQWPGVVLYKPGRITVERPKIFFRECGPTPARATLELVAAPIGVDAAHVTNIVEHKVTAREATKRAEMHARGQRFLGRARVLAQRHTQRPASYRRKRGLSPRIATRNKWARIEAMQRCKVFVAQYREAWKAWAAGVRDVVFPVGTYLMAQRFDVAVADT